MQTRSWKLASPDWSRSDRARGVRSVLVDAHWLPAIAALTVMVAALCIDGVPVAGEVPDGRLADPVSDAAYQSNASSRLLTFGERSEGLQRWQEYVDRGRVSAFGTPNAPIAAGGAQGPDTAKDAAISGVDWAKIEAFTDRAHAVTVYDPVRNRMIVIGGYTGDSDRRDAWALSLSGERTWTHLATTDSDGPNIGCAVYDPDEDRVVVYWTDYYAPATVWELRLSPAPQWAELSPVGTAPSIEESPVAVYDPLRHRMLLFGRAYSPSAELVTEVWALSLAGFPTWSLIEPSGTDLPSGRYGCAATYDSVHDCLVVFGGSTGDSALLADTWSMSLTGDPVWTEIDMASAHPSARVYPGFASASSETGMFLFGGGAFPQPTLGDLWYLDLSETPNWKPVGAAQTPPTPRFGSAAVVTPAGEFIVVGGYDRSFYMNDTWFLSSGELPAWTKAYPAGAAPPERVGHSAIYDPVRGRMIVYGGYGAGGVLRDTWVLDLTGTPSWTWLNNGPGSADHSAVYDPIHDRMVVMGGVSANASFLPQEENYQLSLSGTPAWTQIWSLPAAVAGHAAVYEPLRDRIIIQGGQLLDGTPGHTLALSDEGAEYLGGTLAPELTQHVMIYDPVRDQLVIEGQHSTWTLSMADGSEWVEWDWYVGNSLIHTPMSRAVGVYDESRDCIVLHGTYDRVVGVYTVGYCVPDVSDCESIGRFNDWHAAFDAAAIFDPLNHQVVLFGGSNSVWASNETWALRAAPPQAVYLLELVAERRGVEAMVHWAISQPRAHAGFHVWREKPGSNRVRLNQVMLSGQEAYDFVDPSPPSGSADYWLQEVTTDGSDSWYGPAHLSAAAIPMALRLEQNLPNPFNPSTTIHFNLPKSGRVVLAIYDVRGAQITTLIDADMLAGEQTAEWGGLDSRGLAVPSGVYFARLETATGLRAVKITLAR